MALYKPNTAERVELTNKRVTLNGKPARISGYSMPFATVRDSETGLSAEWCWETVWAVARTHGNFQS